MPRGDSFLRRGPTYVETFPTVSRIGVLVDAVVRYDRMGTNDYLVLEDSLIAVTNQLEQTRMYFQSNRYEVAFGEAPLLGSFMPSASVLEVAQTRKARPEQMHVPLFADSSVLGDAAYSNAVTLVSRVVFGSVGNRGELPTELLRLEPGVTNALKVIAEKKGVRFLLIVQGEGATISGGRQAAGLGALLLAGIIAGAPAIAAASGSQPSSRLENYISLIDLEATEVLLCYGPHVMQLDPADPNAYHNSVERHEATRVGRLEANRAARLPATRLYWAENVFCWFPPRGQTHRVMK